MGGALLIIITQGIIYMATNFKPTTQVQAGSGVFNVQLATTEADRVKGLLGVSSLRPDGGLLMVFEQDSDGYITMHDMQMPIDIVWLDSNKKVVDIVHNAPPDDVGDVLYKPKKQIRYVLEIPAGAAKQSGIKMGETVIFKLDSEAAK